MKMKWKIPLFLAVLLLGGLTVLYAYLLSYNFNRLKPDIIVAVKEATGRNLLIEGDIKVAIGLFPALVIEEVSLQNAGWGSRPRMIQVKRFELQLALLPLIAGTLKVRNAALIDSEIFLEVNNKGVLNLPDLGTKSPTTEPARDDRLPFLPQIALKNVSIIDSRLIYKGRPSTRPITLHLKRLSLKSSISGKNGRLDITAACNKHPLTAKGSVGPLHALLDPERPWPLKLSIKAVGSTLQLAGHIKNVLKGSGMALDFKLAIRDLSRAAWAAGVRLPFKNAAQCEGHFSGSLENGLKLSRMEIKTGRNKLQGSVLVKLKDGKPHFNATLTSERLDLRKTDRPKVATDKKVSTPADRNLFPAKPFPSGFLRKADANVRLRIKQCLFARSALQNLKLNLSLKNGRLTLKPITAVVGSGKLQARASLRAIKKDLVLRAALDIANLNAGRMLKELDISDALEGEFDVSVALSGRGRSVAELMAGANGHMWIIMGKGRLNNRLLGVLGGDLRAGLIQLLYPGGLVGELMEINCFVTRFDAVEGIATAQVLVFDTPSMRAIGTGTVNLKTEELDISLEPITKKGVGTEDVGKISLSLGNLVRPFKLGGTLAAPELSIDAKRAAISIGKALGGFTLFGPLGLAALLIDGDASKKDLCATAVAIARQKQVPSPIPAPAKSPKKKKGTKPSDSFMDGLKKLFK